MENPQMTTDIWMNKWKVISTYLSYDMDEQWGHDAKWNRLVTKKSNTVWIYLCETSEVVTLIEKELNRDYQKLHDEENEELYNEYAVSYLQHEKDLECVSLQCEYTLHS